MRTHVPTLITGGGEAVDKGIRAVALGVMASFCPCAITALKLCILSLLAALETLVNFLLPIGLFILD